MHEGHVKCMLAVRVRVRVRVGVRVRVRVRLRVRVHGTMSKDMFGRFYRLALWHNSTLPTQVCTFFICDATSVKHFWW